MSTNLSPKVALLNFSATLGDNYKNVFNAIVNYANQTGKYRSNSVELLGKSYRVSKSINTSDIEYNGTKLNLYLASFVPTFKDKPNVWFIFNQTDSCMTYFSDTLSRVDNALFDIQVQRAEVSYQDNGAFSSEYMEVISNLEHKSYVSKYNSNELSWQQPNVQTAIQVQPNVVVPTSNETQVSADADITKALEILKNAGLI